MAWREAIAAKIPEVNVDYEDMRRRSKPIQQGPEPTIPGDDRTSGY